MKELIAQLEAKLAELRALQSSDPQVNTAFKAEELTQIKEIEPFVQKRVTALKAHEEAIAKKKENELKDFLSEEEKEEEKEKGLKIEGKGILSPKKLQEQDEKRKAMQTEKGVEELGKKELKELREEVPTVEGKLEFSEDGTLTKAEAKVETGSISIEAGMERHEDGSLKTLKGAIGNEDVFKVGGEVEYNEDGTLKSKKVEIGGEKTFKISQEVEYNPDGSVKSAQAEVGNDKLKVGTGFEKAEDGSLKSVSASVETEKLVLGAKVGTDGGEIKVGTKSENELTGETTTKQVEAKLDLEKGEVSGKYTNKKEDADGNLIEGGELGVELTKDKMKVDGKLALNEGKTEIGGNLEVEKGKAVLALKGRHKFEILKEKEYDIPVAAFPPVTLEVRLGVGINAELTVAAGAKIESDDKKGLDAMAKISTTGKIELMGKVGIVAKILKIVEGAVELKLTASAQATAELGFQLNQTTSKMLAAIKNVKGGLKGGIDLVIGAAKEIRDVYESLGGSGSSLQYRYPLGEMEIFKFTAPDYENGKPWDPSKWTFSEGEAIIKLREKTQWVGDFINGVVEALKAIIEFIGNVLSAIGDFLLAVGRQLIEWGKKTFDWAVGLFSSAYRKEQEAKAQRNADFKKIVESAVKAVKKNQKQIDKLYKLPASARQAALEIMVKEDQLVKDAWRAIYETQDMKEADNIRKQLDADIKEFTVTPTGQFQVGGKGNVKIVLNSTQSFSVKGMSLQVFCAGSRVLMVPVTGFVEGNRFERTMEITLPKAEALPKVDLSKAKWEIKMVLDLPGDIKDKDSLMSTMIVRPAPPTAVVPTEEKAKSGATPTGSLVLVGAKKFTLQPTNQVSIRGKMSIDIGQDCVIPDWALSRASVQMQTRMGSTVLSTVTREIPLKRGVVNVLDSPNLFLPTQKGFYDLAKGELGILDRMSLMVSWGSITASIRESMRKTPVMLDMVIAGFTIYSMRLDIDPGQ